MSGYQSRDAVSSGRVPVPARHRWHKAALIERDGLQAAPHVPFAEAQKPFSVQPAALFVASRFFMAQSHLVQRIPDARARDPELSGRLRLRQVGMRGDMAPQGSPIQFVRGVRPRPLVRQPTRFEPPIHARLTHLEPPGGLRLASTSSNKRHDAQTQIR